MWQGNEGNTFQAVDTEVICEGGEDREESLYSSNAQLILQIQGEDSEKAESALAELISTNMGLIRSIALRFRDRGCDMEDLLQIGTIGMIKAARSFEISRGVRFSTYAVPLIFGEIRRHIRDEGPIKVGRYYKKLGSQLVNERSRIMAEEGREAHVKELAERCGVSAEEAAMALDSVSPLISLSDSAFSEEDGVEVLDTIADKDSMLENERFHDKMAISEAMSRMSDMWRRIVILRYYRERTQQQTADALGLTQVKVSREEKKIMEFLRKELS